MLGLRHVGWLQPHELTYFDYLVSVQPQIGMDPRILIVGISESDIKNLSEWPISDQSLATALANLQAHQPKAIGIDIYRDIPQEPGHAALVKQLQAPNVVAIEEPGRVSAPPSVPKERVGFNDLLLDPDSVVRRNLLFTTFEDDHYYSFALRSSLTYLDQELYPFNVKAESLEIGNTIFPILKPTSGGYQKVDDAGYQTLLRYRSSESVARQITLTEVLERTFQPEWVNNKLILIGATAPSANDAFRTPENLPDSPEPQTAGVIIHAHLVSQILSTVLDNQALYAFWPDWIEVLWIWMFSLTGGILVWRIRHYMILTASLIVAAISVLTIGYSAILMQTYWIPIVAPILGLIVSSGLTIAYKRSYDSSHDALTGLLNRDQFIRQISNFITASNSKSLHLAVLVISLSSLKIIQESLGLEATDEIIKSMSLRLGSHLPKNAIIARINIDQFAVLLNQVKDPKEVNKIADQVIKTLNQEFFTKKAESIFLKSSIGIAFAQSGYKNQPTNLLRDAHTAMYRAQSQGTARYEIFSIGMREENLTRMQLESDLYLALERKEFSLNYQPIVCLQTGKIAGFEALVRWRHPEKGFISPADFIPVTEETGLIVPLGKWIMETACEQLAFWRELFPGQENLIMSINLSPGQFAQPNLVGQVQSILESFNIRGENIKLEITESMVMDNVKASIDLFIKLKDLNIKLGIDDFGTGYSSLSYLSQIPADTLKIDRSFVNHIETVSNDSKITQVIVMLGHSLSMNIIAEGVETQEQLNILRQMGCEYAQGYFMSKPLTDEKATLLLKQNPRW